MGVGLLMANEGEKALELAKRAQELFPNDPDTWHSLGVAQYRAKDFEKAAEIRDKIRALEKKEKKLERRGKV